MKRKYIEFDPAKGWPAGSFLYYECMICGSIVNSMKDGTCACRNLYIDASAGRMGAKDVGKVRLFEEKK